MSGRSIIWMFIIQLSLDEGEKCYLDLYNTVIRVWGVGGVIWISRILSSWEKGAESHLDLYNIVIMG